MEAQYRAEEEYLLKTRKSSLFMAEQQPSLRDDTSDEEETHDSVGVPLAPFTPAYYSSPYFQYLQGIQQPQQSKANEHPAHAQKALKRLRPSSSATAAAGPPAAQRPPEMMVNTLSRVALSRIDRSMDLFLESDSVTVTGTQSGYRMIRATHGCLNFGAYYFEAEILPPITENAHVRLGWATRKANLLAYVGFDQYGFGYRDETGSKVHQAVRIDNYGEPFGPGDVIGCFIYLGTAEEPESVNQIRFFKNGKDQGPAFQGYEIEPDVYYPAVSVYNGARVRVNFGPTFIYGSIHKSLGLHPNPMSEMFPLSPEMRKEHEAQIAQIRREKGIDTQDDDDLTLPEVSVVLTTYKEFPQGLRFRDDGDDYTYAQSAQQGGVDATATSETGEPLPAKRARQPKKLFQPAAPRPPPQRKLTPEERAAMCTGARVQVVAKNSPFHGQVGLIVPDQGWRGGWRSVVFDDGSKNRYRPSELKLVAPAPPKGAEKSSSATAAASAKLSSRLPSASTVAVVADEEEQEDESGGGDDGQENGEGEANGEEQEQDGEDDEQQQEDEHSSGSNSNTHAMSDAQLDEATANGDGAEHVPMDVATTAADETASEPIVDDHSA